MHVDGNATTSMLVAPEAVYLTSLDTGSLEDAQVDVLINGQLSGASSTTQLALSAIVTRSFSAALTHLSRSQLEEARLLADHHGMSLRVTAVPAGHAPIGAFDFHAASLRRTFEYAEHCAENGQLWTTVEKLLAGGAREEGCPVP